MGKGHGSKPINWYAGKQYDDCFGAAHEVLDNFDREFPHWKGRGYKIEALPGGRATKIATTRRTPFNTRRI